ncbi:MAG TPA: caspase family protein [Polyangia bacterium]|nr:caspase family protein [Polyangia bacterium]
MRSRLGLRSFVLLAACALPAWRPEAAAAAEPTGVRLRRFALLVGVNDGGPTRARLRYAASDAHAMARVLESLGGVAPNDLVFVADANRRAVQEGFAAVGRMLRADRDRGVRHELVFYYSGHSDEEGLLLGGERVSYEELRSFIHDAPADLSLAILDSCESGAFTRHKGGTRRAPFLLDASIDTRGHAFLTSSAANEVAQESDRIAASFFTYYLVSGLRGAADANRDRRVTLQEAFQFASQETLARTERTQGGPQHAAYEFDLTGTGDMVVTDVRTTQAGLVLTPELSGRISVREAGGALVAELRKPAGSTVELGVDAGSYVVAVEEAGTVREAQLTLAAGEHLPLARAAFHPGAPLELAATRGDAEPAASLTATPAEAGPPHETTAFKAGFVPRDSDGRTDVDGFSFGFIADRAARLRGMQLSIGYNQVDRDLHGLQLSVGMNNAGPLSGAQIASGANLARGGGRGAQIASGVNVVDGDFRGWQNAAGANITTGHFRGMQMAAGLNLADEASGLQLVAGANVARRFDGAQIGVINVAGDATGFRLGVVNASRETRGFQLGVVNASRETSGFQFGVLNIAAHDDGESFALLNLIGNGIHDLALYGTDALLTNVGLKLGGRHLFTSLSFSYQPGDDLAAGQTQLARGSKRYGYGGGLGWRVPLAFGPLDHLDIEGLTTSLVPSLGSAGNNILLNTARATLAFTVAPYTTVLVGAGMNVMVAPDDKDFTGLLTGWGSTYRDGGTTVRLYPAFLLGLQIGTPPG